MNLTTVAAVVLAQLLVSIGAAWYGVRRAYAEGYSAGFADMRVRFDQYREQNKAILAGLQSASKLPTAPSADFPRPHSVTPPAATGQWFGHTG
jgi:hypothetical protein